MSTTGDQLPIAVAEYLNAHLFGKYRGLVKEVGSGDKLGLIRACVPEVFGEDFLSSWARPCAPFGGKKHGFVCIPEEGDGVWIEFEAGDPNKPIWAGFWWADGEMPDPAGVQTRVLATTSGHKLVLDDDGDEVRLEHGSGPSISLKGGEITLKVGGKKIVISSSAVTVNDGALEVK